jgi:hypothetical protein
LPPDCLPGCAIAGDEYGDAVRMVLADRSAKIGQAMGGAQPVIERALTRAGRRAEAGGGWLPDGGGATTEELRHAAKAKQRVVQVSGG